ncbi:MAG: hypothetical protein ABSB41_17360 [Anaerolineales bacterium]|jgi:hypothetical protein
MIPKSLFKAFVLVLFAASVTALPAAADGGNGGTINLPNDPSLVQQVVNPNGSVNYAGLTDLGVVTQEADWMPHPLGIDIQATYHEYATASGALVLVPTVETDIMGRLTGGLLENGAPQGYYNPGGALTVNVTTTQYGVDYSQGIDVNASVQIPGGAWQGNPSGGLGAVPYSGAESQGASGLTTVTIPSTQAGTEIQADALASYNDLLAPGVLDQLSSGVLTAWSLVTLSIKDDQVYGPSTTILIYTDCTHSPVGCTSEYMAARALVVPPPSVISEPPSCKPPFTTSGQITISGGPGVGSGGKLAPSYPVVVGQDPQRRGVDVQARVVIPPIIYHYFEAVRREEYLCVGGDPSPYNSGCPGPAGKYSNGWSASMAGNDRYHVVDHVWYDCVEHTQVYPDYLAEARIALSLTEESRQWILTSLAQAYPGAHLKHPELGFDFPGPGSLSGESVVWSTVEHSIPIEDPGNWVVTVSALTTGTAVSTPRFATLGLGQFLDYLLRESLVGGLNP